jgi:hypothetical protein
MSTWASICDAWIAELTDIPELASLSEKDIHRYSPWSLEQLAATGTELHLAVWPATDAESTSGFVALPSSMLTQTFAVMIWQGVRDSDRLRDDEAGNAAWLSLHEAVRLRFLTRANVRLGGNDIMVTRYEAGAFPAHAGLRVMAITFSVQVPVMHS